MSAPTQPTASDAMGQCILFAEDDDDFRDLVAGELRRAGFEVVEASDGYALLERLADAIQTDGSVKRFGLILTDVNMPGFTALDVLVGARSVVSHTPVVLLTAFGDPATHALARHLGAAEVLDKPVPLSELTATIARLVGHPPAND